MYNGHQKDLFIKNIISKTAEVKARILFERIASYEQEQGTDICNENPRLYPRIISESDMRIQRFDYFYGLYNLLLNYRVFCYTRGLIDPSRYFQYDPGDPDNALPETEKMIYLYNEFVKYKKHLQVPTPDDCVTVLQETLLKNISTDRNCISMDEYRLAYVILRYLGISENDIMRLKLADIKNVNGKYYVIGVETHCEANTEKAYRAIDRLVNNRTIKQITRAGSVRIRPLGSEYLFAYRDDEKFADEINERVKKRVEKIKINIRKEMSKFDMADCPTLSDIVFRGTIYRMCIHERREDIDEMQELSYSQWFTLYTYYEHPEQWDFAKDPLIDVAPIATVPIAKAVEIKNIFFETYDYLEQNNAWPQ